jgi:tol-pal system protein YbgF
MKNIGYATLSFYTLSTVLVLGLIGCAPLKGTYAPIKEESKKVAELKRSLAEKDAELKELESKYRLTQEKAGADKRRAASKEDSLLRGADSSNALKVVRLRDSRRGSDPNEIKIEELETDEDETQDSFEEIEISFDAPKGAKVKSKKPRIKKIRLKPSSKAKITATPTKVATKTSTRTKKATRKAPQKATKKSFAGTGLNNPEDIYSHGQNLYIAGNFEEARFVFDELLNRFPDHSLADNALYWAGESYYSEGDYEAALDKYDELLSIYPEGNKAPDSLLKSAYAYEQLGDINSAIRALNDIINDYPESETAKKAIAKKSTISN